MPIFYTLITEFQSEIQLKPLWPRAAYTYSITRLEIAISRSVSAVTTNKCTAEPGTSGCSSPIISPPII